MIEGGGSARDKGGGGSDGDGISRGSSRSRVEIMKSEMDGCGRGEWGLRRKAAAIKKQQK